MKQEKYLTETLAKFWEKLDLPSSIITSYSEIEVPFNWGNFYYRANTGETRIHYKKKINKWSYSGLQNSNLCNMIIYNNEYKRLPNRVVKELTEAMSNNLEELLIDSAFKNKNMLSFVTHPLILEFDKISQKLISLNQDEKVIWLDKYNFAMIKIVEDEYKIYYKGLTFTFYISIPKDERQRPYIEEFTYAENKMIYPIVKEYMKRLNAKLDKK
jgi:hypothetical protein